MFRDPMARIPSELMHEELKRRKFLTKAKVLAFINEWILASMLIKFDD